MSRQKDKGTRWESWCERELAPFGAVRSVLHGRLDQGDLHGLRIGPLSVICECKNHAEYRFAEYVAEADAEAVNAGADIGVALVKRRGKGSQSMGDHFVVMDMASFERILEATS